jgi:hypothetical protein
MAEKEKEMIWIPEVDNKRFADFFYVLDRDLKVVADHLSDDILGFTGCRVINRSYDQTKVAQVRGSKDMLQYFRNEHRVKDKGIAVTEKHFKNVLKDIEFVEEIFQMHLRDANSCTLGTAEKAECSVMSTHITKINIFIKQLEKNSLFVEPQINPLLSKKQSTSSSSLNTIPGDPEEEGHLHEDQQVKNVGDEFYYFFHSYPSEKLDRGKELSIKNLTCCYCYADFKTEKNAKNHFNYQSKNCKVLKVLKAKIAEKSSMPVQSSQLPLPASRYVYSLFLN